MGDYLIRCHATIAIDRSVVRIVTIVGIVTPGRIPITAVPVIPSAGDQNDNDGRLNRWMNWMINWTAGVRVGTVRMVLPPICVVPFMVIIAKGRVFFASPGFAPLDMTRPFRSEERRVGKECRSCGAP